MRPLNSSRGPTRWALACALLTLGMSSVGHARQSEPPSGSEQAPAPTRAPSIVVEGGVVTRLEAQPARLHDIGVDEHLESWVPADLPFVDSSGRGLVLGDLIGQRPVLFTFNYSDCPMLCNLQLSSLVSTLKHLDWQVGREFDIVTIGLDPTESPSRAAETKARYLKAYARPGAGAGWHFLTGRPEAIASAAKSLGIRYGFNEARGEYVHPAVVTMTTPKGRIARYLYGLDIHPKTLRLSLVESSQGKIGSSVDRLILYCFHYDATEGRYAPVAMNVMRLAGAATVTVLGGFLGAFWFRQARRRPQEGRGATV